MDPLDSPELSPELKEVLAADPDLTEAADQLHDLFVKTDMEAVNAAVQAGDVQGIASALGLSPDELFALNVRLVTMAQALAERFPELDSLAPAPAPGATAPSVPAAAEIDR